MNAAQNILQQPSALEHPSSTIQADTPSRNATPVPAASSARTSGTLEQLLNLDLELINKRRSERPATGTYWNCTKPSGTSSKKFPKLNNRSKWPKPPLSRSKLTGLPPSWHRASHRSFIMRTRTFVRASILNMDFEMGFRLRVTNHTMALTSDMILPFPSSKSV